MYNRLEWGHFSKLASNSFQSKNQITGFPNHKKRSFRERERNSNWTAVANEDWFSLILNLIVIDLKLWTNLVDVYRFRSYVRLLFSCGKGAVSSDFKENEERKKHSQFVECMTTCCTKRLWSLMHAAKKLQKRNVMLKAKSRRKKHSFECKGNANRLDVAKRFTRNSFIWNQGCKWVYESSFEHLFRMYVDENRFFSRHRYEIDSFFMHWSDWLINVPSYEIETKRRWSRLVVDCWLHDIRDRKILETQRQQQQRQPKNQLSVNILCVIFFLHLSFVYFVVANICWFVWFRPLSPMHYFIWP